FPWSRVSIIILPPAGLGELWTIVAPFPRVTMQPAYASGPRSADGKKRTIAGTQLGHSAIKQRINALEWFLKANEDDWRDHEDYQATRVKLRDHATISQQEGTSRRDKRNRASSGQEQKAMGSSSGMHIPFPTSSFSQQDPHDALKSQKRANI
ncbi:unnamed protein product, partial [Tilletia laevis]